MLRVGLTGGIGAGKSTVAGRLAEHGALLIDADAIAREVVEPGTPGLAAIAAEFGEGVLTEDGALDRPAMAQRVFNDDAARARLNGIMHPLVAERTGELVSGAAEDAIVVHDVPLLVENGLAPSYHLVLIVDAPVDVRVQRLTGARGMPEADARARIATQADEAQRRAAADVWLDNSGPQSDVETEVDALWADRLVPFEANLRHHQAAAADDRLVDPDAAWPEQARRALDRIRLVAGERAVRADHIGSTAVPGLPARDIVDLQLAVPAAHDLDALSSALTDAGFPPADDVVSHTQGVVSCVQDAVFDTQDARHHGGADPGRPVSLWLRVEGSDDARCALLFRDWLRADARADYARVKRELAGDSERYADAKRAWFADVAAKAERWAAETGWRP